MGLLLAPQRPTSARLGSTNTPKKQTLMSTSTRPSANQQRYKNMAFARRVGSGAVDRWILPALHRLVGLVFFGTIANCHGGVYNTNDVGSPMNTFCAPCVPGAESHKTLICRHVVFDSQKRQHLQQMRKHGGFTEDDAPPFIPSWKRRWCRSNPADTKKAKVERKKGDVRRFFFQRQKNAQSKKTTLIGGVWFCRLAGRTCHKTHFKI
jgi:hypothetical protein